MTRAWRFLDRNVLCLHCWDGCRGFTSLRVAWRNARECLRGNR
jgi:hypothetical protein